MTDCLECKDFEECKENLLKLRSTFEEMKTVHTDPVILDNVVRGIETIDYYFKEPTQFKYNLAYLCQDTIIRLIEKAEKEAAKAEREAKRAERVAARAARKKAGEEVAASLASAEKAGSEPLNHWRLRRAKGEGSEYVNFEPGDVNDVKTMYRQGESILEIAGIYDVYSVDLQIIIDAMMNRSKEWRDAAADRRKVFEKDSY